MIAPAVSFVVRMFERLQTAVRLWPLDQLPTSPQLTALMDPHTAAELDLDQIWSLVDDLLAAHGDWLPDWVRTRREARVA